MRVVIVSHGYAPALNARAFRWTAIAEHWAACGHEVHVVTVRSQGTPKSELNNGVHVHRVGVYFDRIALAARQSGHGGEGGGVVPSGNQLKSLILRPLVRAAKIVHDLTWKRIYWPDYAAPWIPAATLKTRSLLSGNPGTALISVSLPFSSHVAAYLAGARSQKGPWIVDTGDPFSFVRDTPTNNHALYSGLNAAADRRILESAAAVTVTTEETRREYARLFGQQEKISVIPPMLSVAARQDAISAAGTSPRSNLVYIGTLNRRIRNPDRLLDLFRELVKRHPDGDLHLHFYGETGDCSESFSSLPSELRSRVHIHGLVSRREAMDASRSALAVVNIGNATHFQLPSKLVEYAAAGRPILNLVKQSPDGSEEFLRGVPGVLTLDESLSVADQAESLADFLEAYRSGSPDPVPDSWFARFTLESVAAAYEEIIDTVSASE